VDYKDIEKKRVKIFVRGFRGVSPLNILNSVIYPLNFSKTVSKEIEKKNRHIKN